MPNLPKKTNSATITAVVLLALSALYLSAVIGLSTDTAVDGNGNLNYSEIDISENFKHPSEVFAKLFDPSSNTLKCTGIGAFVIFLIVTCNINGKRYHRKNVEHGSARWAKNGEARRIADSKKREIINAKTMSVEFKTDDNFLLTENVKISSNTRVHGLNCNVLLCGGSGSGKTWRFVKPNILQANCSFVITDPKGEILQSTGKFLAEAGYEVKVFNLINTKNSYNYNPFSYVYGEDGKVNPQYVIKMIDILIKNTADASKQNSDPFWDMAASALMSAIAFLLIEEESKSEQNFAGVIKMLKLVQVNMRDPTEKSPLDLRFDAVRLKNPESLAVSFYTDFKKAPPETAMSIVMTCNVKLQKFNIPAIANLTYTDTLDLGKIGDAKTALFVIVSSTDISLNFLAAMMYTQMFDCLYDRANFRYGGKLPVHVRCVLELYVPK